LATEEEALLFSEVVGAVGVETGVEKGCELVEGEMVEVCLVGAEAGVKTSVLTSPAKGVAMSMVAVFWVVNMSRAWLGMAAELVSSAK